ncbi:Bug family tripartite tricarboxylate transporter substrate binding protein [Variovorax sp. PAMC 28711]|uniref:Bug family tripartite tricarboxylate transporter substrate binding protein n=1 Tax=Variovorax sp. PAMC 28711 TaxID=1795631 RepID=UPI00078CCB06|nr:tripartite tricarboxylate transporter substrate binding protein [Variovorax sp. PAMC 28711]AMM25955.1 ABC transporter substrate-binding protein [Variovorax sp. PAMC 28711]
MQKPAFAPALSLLIALAVPASQAMAQAAPYPQRPITLVVGYPAGGSTDLVARTLALDLAARLGQPVVVENAGGAGGSIGAQKVASATPDGYTLLVGANNEMAINGLVRKSVKYSLKNFTPIGLLGSQPLVLTTTPTSGIKSTADFLRSAKSRPGQMTYGSSGVGTALHVAGEMVKQQGGVFLTHIPYRGTGPLTTDLIGGNLDLGVFVMSSALPLIRSGKLVALGTTESKRSAVLPNVPALSETPALKNVDIGVWFVLVGPSGMPAPVVARLKTALTETLAAQDYRKTMEASGSVVPTGQPDLDKYLVSETEKYRKIVEFANIKDE